MGITEFRFQVMQMKMSRQSSKDYSELFQYREPNGMEKVSNVCMNSLTITKGGEKLFGG